VKAKTRKTEGRYSEGKTSREKERSFSEGKIIWKTRGRIRKGKTTRKTDGSFSEGKITRKT
jgi:hypothetical protein